MFAARSGLFELPATVVFPKKGDAGESIAFVVHVIKLLAIE